MVIKLRIGRIFSALCPFYFMFVRLYVRSALCPFGFLASASCPSAKCIRHPVRARSHRYIVPCKSLVTWRFRAPCVGVGPLLPLRHLHSLDHVFLPLLVAGRMGSAPLPPLVLVVVSPSGVVRGGLLLPDLRVSGGRSHLLSGPFPAVVCPSIGRPGGTGVRSLGL